MPRENALAARLLVVGLHGLDLLNTLANIGADVSDLVLTVPGQAANLASKEHDWADDKRDADKDDTGELWIGDKEEQGAAQHHQQVAQRDRGRRADHRLN